MLLFVQIVPTRGIILPDKLFYIDSYDLIFQHNTIEAVLQRGEKLDDLVDKSEALSLQSKAFYKTARKTNSCCGTSWG